MLSSLLTALHKFLNFSCPKALDGIREKGIILYDSTFYASLSYSLNCFCLVSWGIDKLINS